MYHRANRKHCRKPRMTNSTKQIMPYNNIEKLKRVHKKFTND